MQIKSILSLILVLINSDKGSYFDALQEEKSIKSYGTTLGRLLCFYVRLLSLQEIDPIDPRVGWFEQHPFTDNQLQSFHRLIHILNLRIEQEDTTDLDDALHQTLKSLFFWTETRTLLDEIHCPVQRFLMVICLRPEGTGFIHVKDISPLIAKLIYSIRATVYLELLRSNEDEDLMLGDNLSGYQVYVKGLIQSPFGFLTETMHLAAYIAGEVSALPQVTWIGKDFKSLAIHGKRVDLIQLQTLAVKTIKECKQKLEYGVMKGMPGLNDINWNIFDPEDDLGNYNLNYSYVHKVFEKKRMVLLQQFLRNDITKNYFTRGIAQDNILWKRDNCLAWLKSCKDFLQSLALACHLEGGQPSRGREFTTIRWKNGVDEIRGVMWAEGTVFLLGRYSKIRNHASHDRLIPR